MVQKSGRPPEFEVDEVLEAAMAVFWEHGYARASLPELEQRTGVARSSLYNSFGGKRGLFDSALDRYVAVLGGQLLEPLRSGRAGLDDVRGYLDRLAGGLDGPWGRYGCLLMGSATEFAGSDDAVNTRATAYLAGVRAALLSALTRAATAGEIDTTGPDALAARADTLVATVLALHVTGRSALPGMTHTLLGAAHAQLGAWEASAPTAPATADPAEGTP